MKKLIAVFSILVVGLVGCGAKTETATFTQSPMEGTKVTLTVEHEGDKVTGVSAKAVFDNEKLQIVDESTADQVAEAFESSSGISDAEMKYTKKETTITYTAPKEMFDKATGFKEGEKNLLEAGFEKE